MRNCHFFQKHWHFCWLCFDFSKNYNTFERNEDCATVFLKWTDFGEMKSSKKYEYVNCKNSSKCCSKSNNIKQHQTTETCWQFLMFFFGYLSFAILFAWSTRYNPPWVCIPICWVVLGGGLLQLLGVLLGVLLMWPTNVGPGPSGDN